jgi:excisionase family DNA binding protein
MSEFDPNIVYMTQADACRHLGISPMQLKELVWQKRIESVRVAGKIMVFRSEIEAFKEKEAA